MAKRKIKGTKILPSGKRKIEVFIEKTVNEEKKRFYQTELTELVKVDDIRRRRKQMRAELHEHLFPSKNIQKTKGLLFSQMLDIWLTDHCKPNLAPRTNQEYAEFIEKYIIPWLNENGNFPMQDFSTMHIRSVFAFMRKNKKEWAINKMKAILSSFATFAVLENELDANIVRLVKTKKLKTKKRKILSLKEIQRFLNFCTSVDYGLIIELMLMTGLRPSEAIALRWQDINLRNCSLHVSQSVTRIKGGGFIFKEPKSEKSIRTISLSKELIQIFVFYFFYSVNHQ